MARGKRKQNRADPEDRPLEITMTDLEAETEYHQHSAGGEDIHAAGTPGGGSAVGGLAGTNVADGDPDNADLEDALGSGIYDDENEDENEQDAPLSGASGGAVGGTPAGSRASGGNIHRGLAPGSDQRGDSTISSNPNHGS